MKKLTLLGSVVALSFAAFGGAALAEYPEKPVTFIVPFPAGGGTDAFARPLGVHLEAQLGRLEARLAAGDHAPGGRVANVDVVLAPLLWRLRILDEQAGTHLLQRFARLRGWSDWLVVQPVLRDILTAEAADLYFAVLHARRALIVDAEVSLAWQSVAGPRIGLRGAG